MLGDSTQFIGAMLILAAAVGYLTLYFRRRIKGGGGGCCGDGCATMAKRNADDSAKVGAGRPFIPSENLADVARRRRAESARAHGKPTQP